MALERVRHRLGAAVRFVDAFTARPVDTPLDVRAEVLPVTPGMPLLPWRALRGRNDPTYRFLVTNETVMPTGIIPVTVTAPGHEYLAFEAFAVALPRPLAAHPPTPARSDYLVQHPLWPTRSFRLPPGETALVVNLVSGGVNPIARLKVTIWPNGSPMPPAPYAYSSDAGVFVYRLPDLKVVNGGVISPTASLRIDLRLPPTYVAGVAPTQIKTDTGAILAVPFAIRLGQVTNLAITIP